MQLQLIIIHSQKETGSPGTLLSPDRSPSSHRKPQKIKSGCQAESIRRGVVRLHLRNP